MKYTVDPWNNFCMVFELPEEYPSDFCFGGGHPVNFQMVDWFNPVPGVFQAGVSKEQFEREVGPIAEHAKEIDIDEFAAQLVPFLEEKRYAKPGREYLVLCDFGAAIRFRGAPVRRVA